MAKSFAYQLSVIYLILDFIYWLEWVRFLFSIQTTNKLKLVYYGIIHNLICFLSDDSEENAEAEQQEDNPVEDDSEDEPSDADEERDSGI